MIKKRNLALETAAELFLTAFNGATPDHGTLERIAAEDTPPEARWFRQTFTGPETFELFAGISSEAAESLPGGLSDLLSNVFHAMARPLGTVAGSAVSCDTLTEEAATEDVDNIVYALRRESTQLGTVILSIPESTVRFLANVIHKAAPPESRPVPLHMDALMNVDLPVSISFGTMDMMLSDVLKLTTGSIVEFNHLLNEPVNVVVNDCLVARGDVVVVDGNYGVRISEVLSPAQK